MVERLRSSGINIIGDVSWGTHFCQFYQKKKDLTDMLIPYFKAGLENNEFCLWVTSQPLEVEEAKEALGKAVPDIDAYLEKGQIEIISYTHGRISGFVLHPQKSLNHLVEKTNQALASGYDGLRFTGSAVWLESADWHHLICYEERLDSVIGNHHLIVLCTYFFERCDTTGIIDVAFNHQFVLAKKEGKWERIENSGRKRAEVAETELKRTLENLEEKVKERTTELEEAAKTLVENERRLYEAQKMAHIGSWEWDIINDKMYWSDETYSIFEFDPLEFDATYDSFLKYIHPDDRDYVDNAVRAALNGKPYRIDFRIILVIVSK